MKKKSLVIAGATFVVFTLVAVFTLVMSVVELKAEVGTAQRDIRTLEGDISFLADTRPLDTVPDGESMICQQQTAPQPTGVWTHSLTCGEPASFADTAGTFSMNDPRLDGRDLRCSQGPTPTPTTEAGSLRWTCYEKF